MKQSFQQAFGSPFIKRALKFVEKKLSIIKSASLREYIRRGPGFLLSSYLVPPLSPVSLHRPSVAATQKEERLGER